MVGKLAIREGKVEQSKKTNQISPKKSVSERAVDGVMSLFNLCTVQVFI